VDFHERHHEQHAERTVRHGQKGFGRRGLPSQPQDTHRQHVAEFLDHCRNHQIAQPDWIEPNHKERELPRHGDRKKGIKKLGVGRE
jgi:hypothetical protein